MIEALIPAVLEHAEKAQPMEACGLAVIIRGKLRYVPCRNIAQGAAQFIIDPADYAAAEDAGAIVGICHSHVYQSAKPSDADRVMCEKTGLPWLIVNWPTGAHHVLEPSGYKLPLIGRQFAHGVVDCWTLVRDYYAELGLQFPDFERAPNWWLSGQDLYRDNFAALGFSVVTDGPRLHDGLLMQRGSKVPNHAAVYIGDTRILHHCMGRLSSRDVYGGYWRDITTHIVRHEAFR